MMRIQSLARSSPGAPSCRSRGQASCSARADDRRAPVVALNLRDQPARAQRRDGLRSHERERRRTGIWDTPLDLVQRPERVAKGELAPDLGISATTACVFRIRR
jgi:hypothetical protein